VVSDIESIVLLVVVWAVVIVLTCAKFVISAAAKLPMAKECRGNTCFIRFSGYIISAILKVVNGFAYTSSPKPSS